VWWVAEDLLTVGLGRVAGAEGGPDLRQVVAEFSRDLGDGGQGLFEVALDVVGEGLEGGDVDDLDPVFEGAGFGLADKPVDSDEEGGEGLTGAGGRGDEGVAPRDNVRPAIGLRGGWRGEAALEPGAGYGVEGSRRSPCGFRIRRAVGKVEGLVARVKSEVRVSSRPPPDPAGWVWRRDQVGVLRRMTGTGCVAWVRA
jgi:hypothetical protein